MREQLDQAIAIKLDLGGQIDTAENRDDERSQETQTDAEHPGNEVCQGEITALHMRQNQFSKIRTLQARSDTVDGIVCQLQNLLQLSGGSRSEQKTRCADDTDDNQARDNEGNGTRKLEPADQRLCSESQHNGDQDRSHG